MKRNKIKLGDRGRDTVSGWEGVATARYEYMNGCVRWELSGKDENGHPKGFVFDEEQLEAVEEAGRPVGPRSGGARGSAPVER